MHAALVKLSCRAICSRACRSAVLAGSMALAVSSAFAQRTLHVAPDGTHDSAGFFPDWSGASTSIQAAVNLATNGDVVLVTNYPSPYLLNSNIVVASSITLRSYHDGAADPANTILDGQGQVRCLYLSSPSALVAGFTLTNGTGLGNGGLTHGGGALIAAGILSNCIVAGNIADARGGGVYASGVQSLITDCLVDGNIQTNSVSAAANNGGGGVYLINSARLRRSRITGNRSLYQRYYNGGGGVFLYSLGEITDCLVSNNIADVMGGGVLLHSYAAGQAVRGNVIAANMVTNRVYLSGAYTYGGGLAVYMPASNSLIADCEVAGNTSFAYTGGICLFHSTLQGCIVSNCQVRGNTAVLCGGGIGMNSPVGKGLTNYHLDFQILNSEISDNAMTGDNSRGGGIFANYAGLRVDGCIVRGNQAYSYGGIYYVGPNTNSPYTVRNCLIAGNSATGASGIVGGLQPLENGWIENCTIAGNQAALQYGGMYAGPGSAVTNTICYFNSAPAHPDWSAAAGVSLAYDCFPTNDFVQWPTVITNAPVFVNTNAGDYRLAGGSPGVNAGVNLPWMTGAADLDGRPRLDRLARQVDMGCYEQIPRVTFINIR